MVGHNAYWLVENQSELPPQERPHRSSSDIEQLARESRDPRIRGRLALLYHLAKRIPSGAITITWSLDAERWSFERVARLHVTTSPERLVVLEAPRRLIMTQVPLFLALHVVGLVITMAWGPRSRPGLCCALGFPIGLAATVLIVLALLLVRLPYNGWSFMVEHCSSLLRPSSWRSGEGWAAVRRCSSPAGR